MKCFRLIITSVFVLLSFLALQAQETEEVKNTEFTLQEAMDYAVENNINATNARLDVKIAKKKIIEYISTGLPNVSGGINYQHLFEVPEMNFGGYIDWQAIDPLIPLTSGTVLSNYVEGEPIQMGAPDNTTFDLNVSQLIFSSSFFIGLQTAKVYKKLMMQSLEKTEKDVRESVASAYYSVLIAEKGKKNIAENLENVSKTIADMEKLLSTGFIEETDVDQLKLTLSNLKNTLATLERQVNLATNLLKFQLGLSHEDNVTLTDKLDNLLLEINIDAITGQGFDPYNNINYQLITTQEDLTFKQYRLTQGAYLPYVSGFYRHQEQSNEPDFNFASKDLLGISVNVPIFASGFRLMKVQQAKLEVEKVRNTKLQVEEGLYMEYNQALSEMFTARDKYNNDEKSMELAEKIYNRTLIKFKEGVSSSSDLTQTHSQLLTTQNNYYMAIFELLNAKNKLDKVMNNY